MNRIELQLVESSRKLTDLIVEQIGSNQELFDEALELMYRDDKSIAMRAAWVSYLVAEKYPWITKPHRTKLIGLLTNTKIDGVKRSALKMLGDVIHELNEDEFGTLADIAFTLAEDPAQAIAVKAFSIDILFQVSIKYPEAIPEITAILESIIPNGSRGLKNKCNKMLKQVGKTGKFH